MNPAPIANLLKMPVAAARLSMCRRSLERLIADGEFPHPVRFTARMVRVPESDVTAYIAKKIAERNRRQP